MKKIIAFLLKSSANPAQTSATVKFALLGVIPYLMQAFDLVCSLGQQCYTIDANILQIAIKAIADGVFYALSLVSVIGTLWGAYRKVKLTVTGNNRALQE